MKRALVICPGRGSYARNSLGQLQERSKAVRQIIAQCNDHRRTAGRTPISELDAAETFRGADHVAGENASLLTFACSIADYTDIDLQQYHVVGVLGNSMGWYTALAVAGVLPMEDAIRLVDTMGSYQRKNVIGGQILYPTSDEAWQPNPTLLAHVDAAIANAIETGHAAFSSIRLGGFAVLAGDRSGVRCLLDTLPPQVRGATTFPIQLPYHSAFHTPLMEATALRAQSELKGLRFTRPTVPLTDGHGVIYRPRWADPEALRSYTLGAQVTEMFDYEKALRCAIRHAAPEVIILLGPGNSLGGPTARILVNEHWVGLQDREQFDRHQSEEPLLLSFGITRQRAVLTG